MFAHFSLHSCSVVSVRFGNIAVKTCTNVDICRLAPSLNARLGLNLSGNETKLGGARGKNPETVCSSRCQCSVSLGEWVCVSVGSRMSQKDWWGGGD